MRLERDFLAVMSFNRSYSVPGNCTLFVPIPCTPLSHIFPSVSSFHYLACTSNT